MGKKFSFSSFIWIAASIGVGGAIAIGCGGSDTGLENPSYKLSISRLKALNTGLMLYINDDDDVLPLGPGWMDVLDPYVPDPSNFRSPAVEAAGYGYAFNSAIAGQNLNSFPNPDTTLSIFDSTDLSRSAVEPTSTLPSPARYLSKNTIAYLDGHVQEDDPTTVPGLFEQSRTQLKKSTLGIQIYTSDYDDNYPMANTWMDAITPYRVPESALHSPLAQKSNASSYGYAFNIDLAGISAASLESPATTELLFDSTVLTRNATASTATKPNPGRYGGNNTISHADGSVP